MLGAELTFGGPFFAVRGRFAAARVAALGANIDHPHLCVLRAKLSSPLAAHQVKERGIGAATAVPAPLVVNVNHSFPGMLSTELALVAAHQTETRNGAAALVRTLTRTAHVDHSWAGVLCAELAISGTGHSVPCPDGAAWVVALLAVVEGVQVDHTGHGVLGAALPPCASWLAIRWPLAATRVTASLVVVEADHSLLGVLRAELCLFVSCLAKRRPLAATRTTAPLVFYNGNVDHSLLGVLCAELSHFAACLSK